MSRTTVTSLEESTTRVAAAQVAGLIALWTQLSTFDTPAAPALAWLAWLLLVISLLLLARLVAPRRLARFWGGVPSRDVLDQGRPIEPAEEAALVRALAATMTLTAAVAAYVLEKL